VLVTAHLNRGIGDLGGLGARREIQLGEQGKGRERHPGDALGGELGFIASDDNLLNVGVGGANPMGLKRGAHCVKNKTEIGDTRNTR